MLLHILLHGERPITFVTYELLLSKPLKPSNQQANNIERWIIRQEKAKFGLLSRLCNLRCFRFRSRLRFLQVAVVNENLLQHWLDRKRHTTIKQWKKHLNEVSRWVTREHIVPWCWVGQQRRDRLNERRIKPVLPGPIRFIGELESSWTSYNENNEDLTLLSVF